MTQRIVFEQELKELLEDLSKMSLVVEDSYISLFQALAEKNDTEIQMIRKNDQNINEMKRQIETTCLKLIMKQQPVATDLRIVSSVLKAVTDIERVGNHVCDMAELLLRINCKPLDNYSLHLNGMVTATKEIYTNSIEAFVMDNSADSNRVVSGDDVIDTLFNKVKKDIITGLKEEIQSPDDYIDIMMLTKYLEKIGDHAVNIAKWQIFRKTGELF